jgi:hypothetical protein
MLTRVEILEGDKPGDRRVVYRITEGELAKVAGISFKGNAFLTAEWLQSLIQSSRDNFDLCCNYSSELVEKDILRLEEYYRDFGFKDVRVRRELVWSEDNRSVEILFHIDEGVCDRTSLDSRKNRLLRSSGNEDVEGPILIMRTGPAIVMAVNEFPSSDLIIASAGKPIPMSHWLPIARAIP